MPYNPYFLNKYGIHIKVEVCGSIKSGFYLYKYVYKDPWSEITLIRRSKHYNDNPAPSETLTTFAERHDAPKQTSPQQNKRSLGVVPQQSGQKMQRHQRRPRLKLYGRLPKPDLYRHEILSRDKVRVLRLERAVNDSDPVRCTVEEISIHNSPEYTAMSYAWDAENLSEPVYW